MYENILKLKAAMWEHTIIDVKVMTGWRAVYDKLENHIENEELDVWCGVILKELFPDK